MRESQGPGGFRPKGAWGRRIISLTTFLLAAAALAAPALQERPPPETPSLIEHEPVAEYAAGRPLGLRARVHAPAEWVGVFFRCAGFEDFQARPMALSEDGSYVLEFDTSRLPSPDFHYYLAAKTEGGVVTFPDSGRDAPLSVSGRDAPEGPEIPSEFPDPGEETGPPAESHPFPLQVSGSGQTALAEGDALSEAETFPVAGNVRFFMRPPRATAVSFGFDSNFSYSNTPLGGETPFDLSQMNAALFLSAHTLRAGDLTLAESEYSVQGLGRRGMEYLFDNRRAYVRLFTANAQQSRGFKGFGLPRPETALLGGAAGFRVLDEALCLKVVYVSGRDSPGEGGGVALPDFVPGYGGREGSVLAVSEENRLFDGRLNFKAEFAHSRHDADLEDGDDPVSGSALTLGTGFSAGFFNALATYRRISREFNSIGLPFTDNDRCGLEAFVGIASGPFSLTGSLVSQHDNVAGDSAEATTRLLDGNVNLSLALAPQVQLVFGYRRGRQETTPGADPTVLQDGATGELSGSLSLAAGPSSSLTLSVISSDLSSRANPEREAATFSLNLGGSHVSERVVFSPTLGVTTHKDKFTGARLDTVSAMTAAEFFLFPRAFSLLINGSLGRSDVAPDMTSSNLDLLGGLNLHVGEWIRFGSLLLSVKGRYSRSVVSDLPTVDWKVFVQCDLSF